MRREYKTVDDTGIGEKSVASLLSPIPYPLSIFVSVGDGNIISGSIRASRTCSPWAGWRPCRACSASRPRDRLRWQTPSWPGSRPSQARFRPNPGRQHLGGPAAGRCAGSTGGTRDRRQLPQVSDAEILEAIAELGEAGIFAEPAGATSYAGLRQGAPIRPDQSGRAGPGDQHRQRAERCAKPPCRPSAQPPSSSLPWMP